MMEEPSFKEGKTTPADGWRMLMRGFKVLL
jgi:hypothetical protein